MTNVPEVEQSVDPVEYVKSYFTKLKEKEVSILVGSIILLGEVKFRLLQSLLNLQKIQEVEEKIGRLLQTDLMNGTFTKDSFILKKTNYQIKQQLPNLTLDDRILLAYLKARASISIAEIQKAFDLNYETVIFILSSFITRGLIISNLIELDHFEFIVNYKLPTKEVEDITVLEKKIVGYGMLRGNITVRDITTDLEIPEHKVQSTLVDMILSNLIKCSFTTKKNILQNFTLLVKIHEFQVTFPTRNIDIMSINERLIIGLASLRKKMSLKELIDVSQIQRSTTLSIIAQLTSTKEFGFKLTDNEIITPLSEPVFPITKSIDELSIRSLFNYRVLFGIVSSQKQMKISQISDKMSVPANDVIKGLVDLYLSGIIIGYLKNMGLFILEAKRNPETRSEVALATWERIIMGALISEGVISWPKIAALLEVDRDTARERAYAFISRGIANTLAKDTVLMLRNIPKLPPLTQVADLQLIDQQVFGYLVAKGNPTLKELRSLFSINSKQALRKIYLLCGSGLIIVQRTKDSFKISQPRIPEPEVPVKEMDVNTQLLIKYIEESQDTQYRVSLKFLSRMLKIHTNDVVKNISILIAQGYYQGYFTSKRFVKTRAIIKVKEKPKCFSCGIILQDYRKPCPECTAVPPICSVCKGAMSSADDLVACPHCRHEAHPSHIKEWLKIKGECPVCRNKLNSEQLTRITY
ncbi:MAG: hypothetical protein ACXAD7_00975 [Candidatus Kariarchaeaceae archaeon]|jgi:predicted DNA-binding transcriptional regulator